LQQQQQPLMVAGSHGPQLLQQQQQQPLLSGAPVPAGTVQAPWSPPSGPHTATAGAAPGPSPSAAGPPLQPPAAAAAAGDGQMGCPPRPPQAAAAPAAAAASLGGLPPDLVWGAWRADVAVMQQQLAGSGMGEADALAHGCSSLAEVRRLGHSKRLRASGCHCRMYVLFVLHNGTPLHHAAQIL
jgi:hypothetical protein